ncbi:MAG: tRNA 2-selenouridine(34) synthase MnmH [Gloeobacterales cyanobacterium]
MSLSPLFTEQFWGRGVPFPYDEIIDVRSPSEFGEDHIPDAINLPVLEDAERAEVGTLYKQVSPFSARKVGAAMVSRNISRHLESHFADKDKDYQPLIYCWRGGQRSGSMAKVLVQIGWRVTLLQGGYKTYRAHVRQQLQDLPEQFTFRILAGSTGTGKTHVLKRLAQRGVQVLDLEGLAQHRGSLLGALWEISQPTQKYFESLLLEQFQQFDPTQPIWVEAESNKIGQVYIPQTLWQKMQQAEGIEIQMPLAKRIEHLLEEYPHLVTHPEVLKQKLEQLKSRHGKQQLEVWNHLIDTQQWEMFIGMLLEQHYDPSYMHSFYRCYPNVQKTALLLDTSGEQIDRFIHNVLVPAQSPLGNSIYASSRPH